MRTFEQPDANPPCSHTGRFPRLLCLRRHRHQRHQPDDRPRQHDVRHRRNDLRQRAGQQHHDPIQQHFPRAELSAGRCRRRQATRATRWARCCKPAPTPRSACTTICTRTRKAACRASAAKSGTGAVQRFPQQRLLQLARHRRQRRQRPAQLQQFRRQLLSRRPWRRQSQSAVRPPPLRHSSGGTEHLQRLQLDRHPHLSHRQCQRHQ